MATKPSEYYDWYQRWNALETTSLPKIAHAVPLSKPDSYCRVYCGDNWISIDPEDKTIQMCEKCQERIPRTAQRV